MQADAPSPWPPFVETWVLPYLYDDGLWPVLFALLGHFAVALAPVLVFVVRDRNAPAGALLVLLIAITALPPFIEIRHLRRPGAFTATMAVLWAMAGVMAWAAGSYGLL